MDRNVSSIVKMRIVRNLYEAERYFSIGWILIDGSIDSKENVSILIGRPDGISDDLPEEDCDEL